MKKKKKEIYKNPFSKRNDNRIKDWAIALNTPYEDMTEEQMDKLETAASNWEVCACGNLCKDIPRSLDGSLMPSSPEDEILYNLGFKFCEVVEDMSIELHSEEKDNFEYYREKALEIHNKIEDRAIIVLKEIRNKG